MPKAKLTYQQLIEKYALLKEQGKNNAMGVYKHKAKKTYPGEYRDEDFPVRKKKDAGIAPQMENR